MNGAPSQALTLKMLWQRVGEMFISVIAKLVDAIERALLFMGSVAIHRGVDVGMGMVRMPKIPEGELVQTFVDTIVYVAFIIIYVALLYELVAVFIPVLKPFQRREP